MKQTGYGIGSSNGDYGVEYALSAQGQMTENDGASLASSVLVLIGICLWAGSFVGLFAMIL